MINETQPKTVDTYLLEGCGRCPLGATPACKVHQWHEALTVLRKIVLESGLKEEIKWGFPCYTHQGKNVLMLVAFKESCVINFFKGVLIDDRHGILSKPGESSQSVRVVRFTTLAEVEAVQAVLPAYIQAAIAIEASGAKVTTQKNPEPWPEELVRLCQENSAFKAAFEALTPGRQRGYILYFSAAKQAKSREARIKKYIPQILAGKGIF